MKKTNNISCDQLIKSHHNQQTLQGISLSLEPGCVVGLLGANGAGKSTLIKCILGLIRTDGGHIDTPDGARLGYLPELANLPPSISAWAIVQLGLQLTQDFNPDTAASLLSRVHLSQQHWHKPLRSCSKGMRQRVALAYAIAGKPQWLILDEPMSGLDAMGRKQFLDILLDLNQQGVGMLVCSHIVPDLVRLCNQVLLMHRGKIIDEIDIIEHNMVEAEALERKLMQMADSHE